MKLHKPAILAFFILVISLLTASVWAKDSTGTYGPMTYTIQNGSVTITGCDKTAAGDLVIPDTLEGYPVTAISDGAFLESSLQSIYIPDSVTELGDSVFRLSRSLETVRLPEQLTALPENAFSYCQKLQSIQIPDSVTVIGRCCFELCSSLKELQLPAGLTEIPERMCTKCTSLERVSFPDGLNTIRFTAFYECRALTEAILPDSVTEIEADAFSFCTALSHLVLSENLDYLGAAFVRCDSLISVHLPESLTRIQQGAFSDCHNLRDINLPSGITYVAPFSNCTSLTSCILPEQATEIGLSAFYGCSNLATVYIPATVRIVRGYAFFGCDSLTDIYYGGTEEEWNSIDFGTDFYGDVMPINATIHFGATADMATGIKFRDVSPDAYYADAVSWAVGRKITSGIGNNLFAPDRSCTRAQIVTFLWRAAGSPEPQALSSTFVDIPVSTYYSKAVRWAAEQGITNGVDSTHFSPDAICTRAQIVTFLWRSMGQPHSTGNVPAAFTDVDQSAYYASAAAWAVEQGVTYGTTAQTFSPSRQCSRAQAVTFLYRANDAA